MVTTSFSLFHLCITELVEFLGTCHQDAVSGHLNVCHILLGTFGAFGGHFGQDGLGHGIVNDDGGVGFRSLIKGKNIELAVAGNDATDILVGELCDRLVHVRLYEVELIGCKHSLVGSCRVGIVFVNNCRGCPRFADEAGSGIYSIGCLDGHCHGFFDGQVAFGFELDGVVAGLKAVKYKCAVIVVVRGVASHFGACLLEDGSDTIERLVGIRGAHIGLVCTIFELLVLVANHAVDSTGSLFGQAEVVGDTVSICVTFDAAHIPVHGTVTCGLIGVEVAFYEETWYVVLEHSEVALATGDGAGAAASIEADVTTEVSTAVSIGRPHHMGVPDGVGPAFACHIT